jgi:predicted lipid-binding transport protein (Tim44 family)
MDLRGGCAVPPRDQWTKSAESACVIVQIVILAMIAAFLGLRLYSVLGRRAEHEEEHVPKRVEQREGARQAYQTATPATDTLPRPQEVIGYSAPIEQGLRAIAAADRRFDLAAFMEGAKGAYRLVLEAFWRGDKEELKELCDDDVYESFAAAIDAREKAGETLENRLIRIEETALHAASLDGDIARIAVVFTADVAALTRDKDGNMIAGSLNDAVESRDIWTFSRHVNAVGPDWLLDETDEG